MKCCKQLIDGVQAEFPFQKAIATGYHDGPTEGFCECSACGQVYSFRMYDWDSSQDLRVFGFALLSILLEEAIARLVKDRANQAKVILVPPLQEPEEMWVRRMFTKAPSRVAAIRGWPGTSSVWRDISSVDPNSITDWFAFLWLSRS